MADSHRFGFAALAGEPNVGKSTLLNRIIGKKISIVSRRPQTTRHRILGIKSSDHYQIVFADTPGLHTDERKPLNRIIGRTAMHSMTDVDIILFMIDHKGWSPERKKLFSLAKSKGCPIILLINKIDKLKDKSQLLPIISESRDMHDFKEIMPISALKLAEKEKLIKIIAQRLPSGPKYFSPDQITDRDDRFMASELVREQTFRVLGRELPYSVATEVTEFKRNDKDILCIDMILWVEKQSQKAIVVGRGGRQLKEIGTRARMQIEKTLDMKVYLNIRVKVKKGWAGRERMVRSLGYMEFGRDFSSQAIP